MMQIAPKITERGETGRERREMEDARERERENIARGCAGEIIASA